MANAKALKLLGVVGLVIARELNLSNSTISELLRNRWKGSTGDKHLARLHNWLELSARRDSIVRSREFVKTAVAHEILTVASVVAETCQMGLIFGPARIGKTFTLRAIEGDQAFGAPVLVTVDESTTRPFALCRSICERFDVSKSGTFDVVFRRLTARLKDTKRMLMFDEADLASYPALEMIRHLHDATGCPVLFSGKPKIYEHLGFRQVREVGFSEKLNRRARSRATTIKAQMERQAEAPRGLKPAARCWRRITHGRLDQMAGRMVIKRDLTERTRGENGEPLYRLEDIRALVRQSGLKLQVSPEALRWLQGRASTLGMGGIGKAMVSLYLAAKVAFAKGDAAITVDHLEDAEELTMGSEDAEAVAEAVAEASGMRRVV